MPHFDKYIHLTDTHLVQDGNGLLYGLNPKQRLQQAVAEIGPLLKTQPQLLPANYTGFVNTDNGFYKPIRDAGLATGKLTPRQ